MSNAEIIIDSILIAFALFGVGLLIYRSRKNGTPIPWDKVDIIIVNLLLEAEKVKSASVTYQALEDYSVQYIMNQIQQSDLLSDIDKSLFTADLIRNFIRPQLIKLYNSK